MKQIFNTIAIILMIGLCLGIVSALDSESFVACGGDGSKLTGVGGGAETDPYWTGNYSAYNNSWSNKKSIIC